MMLRLLRDPSALMLLLTLGWLPTAVAQDAGPVAVDLPAAWAVGTEFEVVLEKGRRDHEQGSLVSDNHSTSRCLVEVLEAGDDGFVFRWTMTGIELPEEARGNRLAAKMARMMVDVPIELEADRSGTVTGLRNPDEVRRVLQETFAVLRDAFLEAGLDEATADQVLVPIRDALLGENMAEVMTKEFALFHMPLGARYEEGVTLRFDDLLPSPFGGDPIPSECSLSVRSVDVPGDRLVLDWNQTLDEEAGRAMVELMRTMLEVSGEDPPAEADEELPLADVRDEGTYEIALSDGLPRAISWSRTIIVGEKKRVDWLRFETHGPR